MQRKIVCRMALVLLVLGWLGGGVGCSPKPQKGQRLARAERYFAAGEYEKAMPDYLEVFAADLNNVTAIKALGQIYLAQARMDKAGPFLITARNLATNDMGIRDSLATVFLATGQYKEARAEASYVLDHSPGDEDAPMLLVESSRTRPELDAVLALLEKISPPTARKAGCEVARAAVALRQEPPDVARANEALGRAITLNPKMAGAYSVLGALCETTNGVPAADVALRTAAELSSTHSPRWLRYAQFKLAAGDVESAKKLLNQMVKQTPDYTPAWLELARVAAAERKFEEAVGFLAEVHARDPDSFDGQMLDAGIKLSRGDNSAALVELEGLAKRYPRSIKLSFDLARAYVATGDIGKAATLLRRVLQQDPKNVTAIVSLAQLDLARGDASSAIYSLKQLVTQQPTLDGAWQLLARAYYTQGEVENTLQIYRQLAGRHPAEPGFPLAMGQILIEKGRRAEARAAFDRAQELAPDYPAALTPLQQLVRLDLLEQENARAMQRVTKLLTAVPQAPEPRLLEAEVLLAARTAQGTNQAEAALLKATELKPDYWAAYLALARLYKDAKQNGKALSDLRGIVAKNPKDSVAQMLIGVLLTEEKDYEGARAAYETILKSNPKFVPALNNAAYLYSERLGDLERAFKYASLARDLEAYDPATADTFGWVLYHRREYRWAASLLAESASKLPDEAEVRHHLGMAYYQMGQEDAAGRELKRALALSGDFEGRAEVERRLAVLALPAGTTNAATIAALEKRTVEQPEDVVAWTRLGRAHLATGNNEQAATAWEAALRANPECVPVLLELAGLYAGPLQQSRKGLELVKAANKLEPDNFQAMRLYGWLSFQTGNYPYALELLRQVAQKQPNDREIQFELAEAAYYQGFLPEALGAGRVAAQAGPGFARLAEARQFLALIDPAAPKPAPALVAQILVARPDYLPALMAQATAAEAKPEVAVAEQIYERVLTLSPNFFPALKRLAVLYGAEPENAKKAFKLGMQALAAFPGDPEIIRTLGFLSYAQGDWQRAAQFLQQLAGGNQEDAQSLFYLGMAQNQLKRRVESQNSLQRAIGRGLSGKNAEEANRVLSELKSAKP